MFYFTKRVVFTTIILTAWVGVYLDHSVPYFPIEISRTATGPRSRIIFPVGATIAFLVAIAECLFHNVSFLSLLPFSGFMLLTLVDDEQSWTVHMAGVALMMCSMVWKLQTHYIELGILAFMYSVRIVLKAIVSWNGSIGGTFNYARKLMYTGRFENIFQVVVYRVAGVLQWIVLGEIMILYCDSLK